MYSITRRLEWDMGHRIHEHGGKCASLHGHRYAAEIELDAKGLDGTGFVVDFGNIKALVGEWIDRNLDHTVALCNDDPIIGPITGILGAAGCKPVFATHGPPTAENIAKLLYGVSLEMLKREGLRVVSVTVWETPNCRARYPVRGPGWRMDE